MNIAPLYPGKNTNFINSTLLLVEDNPDHLAQIETTLQECMPGIQTIGVVNRETALGYLDSEWQRKRSSLPKLILLDLYMPSREEGLQTLRAFKDYFEAKSQPCIPIVIFSFSDRLDDVHDCYALGANAYLVKSPDRHDWKEYFECIRNFWLEIVSLPMHEL